MKIEQIFDYSKLLDFGTPFIVDNYGNVISANGKYVITPNGTLKTLNSISPFKALNGYVYADNRVFNADGDLVETTFIPPAFQLSGESNTTGGTKDTFLIKSEGSTNYYYLDSNTYNGDKGLYKVTFTNEIKYSVEKIALEGYSDSLCKKTLVENDRIYYLTNTEVGFWDIETGLSTLLTNEYIFNDIWTDNQGNLCFNALTSHLDNVEGIINDDNSITVGIFSNGFDVIYIKPISLF